MVSDWVWWWGVVQIQRIIIHIYLQSMFILSFQSNVDLLGFGTKYLIFPVIGCTPHHGGHHGGVGCPHDALVMGVSDTPLMPPIMGVQSITVNKLQTLISIHLHHEHHVGYPPMTLPSWGCQTTPMMGSATYHWKLYSVIGCTPIMGCIKGRCQTPP